MRDNLGFISKFIQDECAIVIGPDKYYLIESRLKPLIEDLKLSDFGALVDCIQCPRNSDLRRRVLEALTTHETFFFRDFEVFEVLKRSILPELIARNEKTKTLSIWSAAASTGQEVYSIALLLRQHFPVLANWKVNLIATDISQDVLERARRGEYNQFEINRGLPAEYLVNYFSKSCETWKIDDTIRSMVDFRQLNLIHPWPVMPRMDIVFIRNVLIYFESKIKIDILKKMAQTIASDGFLFLGGSETTLNLTSEFERHSFPKVSCYRRKN